MATERTPHISELTLETMYPDKYLKAAHLQGHAPTVIIERIEQELVPMQGGKKAMATVITFKGKSKQFIACKTNGYAIAVLLGSIRPKDWVGKRITLTADRDQNKNTKSVEPCIRILGSPDASPKQAAEYSSCWKGDRMKGALCTKLKLAVQRMLVTSTAPVEAEDPPLPDDNATALVTPVDDDDWTHDGEPEAPAEKPADPPAKPMREPGQEG